MRSIAIVFLFGLALASFTFSGCDQTTQAKKGKDAATSDDHDHDADDHDHGEHAHGPNGGHLFEFAEGDYHGEWKHYNDNFVIRVYILDKEGKKNQAVASEFISIKRTTGDDDAEFTLDPESPDDDGNSVVYSLDSQDLSIAMNLGVIIEMKLGDKTYTANIPAHEPHDH